MATFVAKTGIDILCCMNSSFGTISIAGQNFFWHEDMEYRSPLFKNGAEFVFSIKAKQELFRAIEIKVQGFDMYNSISVDAHELTMKSFLLIQEELLLGLLRTVENKVKEVRGY